MEAGRLALPGVALDGLIDPDRPPLDRAVHACFDAVHPNAYAAGSPACLVRLSAGDPLFVARLIQTVPSVAVMTTLPADRLERALSDYWLRRSDAVVEREALWATVRQRMRLKAAAADMAVFTTSPAGALATALRERGARVFGAEMIPLLSPRFGRTLFIIEGRADEAGLLTLLRRFGGDVVLTGTCLLGAYEDAAAALATAELGRDVPLREVAQWRAGIARPGALLLGAVAAAARHLYVPSRWMAEQVGSRHGRSAVVLPAIARARPGVSETGLITAEAMGLQAEACVWALELLRFWRVEARMRLDVPAAERAALGSLAVRLGVADRLAFGAGSGAVAAALAMRGDGVRVDGLVGALSSGRCCVASRGLAEGIDIPPWLQVIPDQASPPLLAAALRTALAGHRPSDSTRAAWAARHEPDAVAACLL